MSNYISHMAKHAAQMFRSHAQQKERQASLARIEYDRRRTLALAFWEECKQATEEFSRFARLPPATKLVWLESDRGAHLEIKFVRGSRGSANFYVYTHKHAETALLLDVFSDNGSRSGPEQSNVVARDVRQFLELLVHHLTTTDIVPLSEEEGSDA